MIEEPTFRYVFSGQLTEKMKNMIQDLNGFKPLNILVSQLTRAMLEQAISWKEEGFCQWVFCDSGAFSVHTGKAKITQDEYIEYINTIIDRVDIFAQLDTIPGTFGKPKSDEDYIKSAEDSWTNFLYMRARVTDKTKIMPVYHFGEDVKYLKRMLEYVDEDGDKLDYIGISPANDASVQARMQYLQEVYDVIKASNNPNVKTHVYGFTSLNAMSKFPCYSADSISHRLIAGYNKVFTKNFGIISTSKQSRSVKTKSNQSFIQLADDYNLEVLKSEFEEWGLTLEFAKKYGFEGDDIFDWLSESNEARVAYSVNTIQYLSDTKYAYNPQNLKRQRKLW